MDSSIRCTDLNKELNRVTHIYGIARDITERKHHEERLSALSTELMIAEERERRRMADTSRCSWLYTGIVQNKIRALEQFLPANAMQEQYSDVRLFLDNPSKYTHTYLRSQSADAL